MTSVERVMEYTKLEQESQRKDKSVAVPDSWPKYGIITSEGLYYSHHHTLPYVLKKLNFCIRAEEKVIRPECYCTVVEWNIHRRKAVQSNLRISLEDKLQWTWSEWTAFSKYL